MHSEKSLEVVLWKLGYTESKLYCSSCSSKEKKLQKIVLFSVLK